MYSPLLKMPSELEDAKLLDRATELGRILFTQDVDFLALAQERQANGIGFSGVIYVHQQRILVGQCIRDLEMLMVACSEADFADAVTYLPL